MEEEDRKYIEKKAIENAKLVVDTLFDKGLLNPKLKRNDMRVLDKLIALHIDSAITNYIMGQDFLKDIKGLGV